MPTRDELANALRKADAAGNADDARRIAAAIRAMDSAPVVKPAAVSNGSGMGPVNPMVAMGQRAQEQLPTGYVRPEVVNRENPIITAQRAGQRQAMDNFAAQKAAEEKARQDRREGAGMGALTEMPMSYDEAGNFSPRNAADDDLSKTIIGSPIQFGQGLAEGSANLINNATNMGAEGINALNRLWLGDKAYEFKGTDIQVPRNAIVDEGGVLQSNTGIVPRVAGQIMSTRVPLGKALPGGGVGAEISKDALAYAAATDKDAGRLSDFAPEGTPLDALRTREGESYSEAFAKNVLEDAGLSTLATAILKGGNAALDRVGQPQQMVPTNAGGANLGPVRPQPVGPPPAPVAPAAQATPPSPVQTAAAPPAQPPPPVNAPPVAAGAPAPPPAVRAPQAATPPPVAPVQAVPTLSREEGRAADLFIRKLEADGLTVDDIRKIRNSLANRGDSGVYETTGELAGLSGKSSGANLRGLQMAGGAAPGPLQEALVARVNENTAKLPARLSRSATRATGQKAENAVATLDELDNRLKTEAGPLYDDFYNAPVDPRIYEAEIAPVLNAPHGQAAMERAARGLGVEAASLQARVASGGGGTPQAQAALQRTYDAAEALRNMLEGKGGTLPPLALDHVKRAFDDLIDEAGQATYTGGNLRSAKRNFAESVSNATGGAYGNALGTYEGIKRLEEAFDVGLNAINKKTWELERDLAKGRGGSQFTGGEVEAIAMGVARSIEDLIEANDQAALTKLLKGKALKNIETALGSEKAAKQFEQSIKRLAANREWGRRVAGGSDTAMRQAAIRDAGVEGEDTVTRVLDRVESSGNTFSLPGLVNEVAVKPIARTGRRLYQQMRYPGVYDEGVNRALTPLIATPMTPSNLDEVIRIVEARQAQKSRKRLRAAASPPAAPAQAAAPRTRAKPPKDAGFASPSLMAAIVGGGAGALAAPDMNGDGKVDALERAIMGVAGAGAGGAVMEGATRMAKGRARRKAPAAPPPPAPRPTLSAVPDAPYKPTRNEIRISETINEQRSKGISDAEISRSLTLSGVNISPERIDYFAKMTPAKPRVGMSPDRVDEFAAKGAEAAEWRSFGYSDDEVAKKLGLGGPLEERRRILAAYDSAYESQRLGNNQSRDVALRPVPDAPRPVSAPKSEAPPVSPMRPKPPGQTSNALPGGTLTQAGLGAGGAAYGWASADDINGDGVVDDEDRMQKAVTLGVLGLTAGGIARTRGKQNKAQVNTFGGVNAKTADRQALARAQQMEKSGADRNAIWDETGWFKGVDGKWRFEIDDSGAKLTRAPTAPTMEDYDKISRELYGKSYGSLPFDGPGGKLGPTRQAVLDRANEALRPDRYHLSGQLDHASLYEAYPETKSISTFMGDKSGPGNGSYDPVNRVMTFDTFDYVGDPLHEAQHAVQGSEGFARGGSPDMSLDGLNWNAYKSLEQKVRQPNLTAQELKEIAGYKSVNEAARDLSELRKETLISASYGALPVLPKSIADRLRRIVAYDQYKKLAGETEARNTATRMDMTPEQRRAKRPWETQDVPDDQQIVRFGGGKSESRPKAPATMGFGGTPSGSNALRPAVAEPVAPRRAISRTATGAMMGGAVGALGSDADAQTETVAQLRDVNTLIAELQSDMKTFDSGSPEDVQRALNRKGFPVKVDGRIGPESSAAIAKFRTETKAELDKQLERRKELEAKKAFEDARPPEWKNGARELAPWLGAAAGAVLGYRGRAGAVRKAGPKAAAEIAKADALLTPGPVKKGRSASERAAFKDQPAKINEFWRMGGAGANVPFKTTNKGEWKPRSKATEPSDLFPQKRFRTADYAVIGTAIGEAGVSTQLMINAEAKIKEAQAAVDEKATPENIRRLEQAKDELALATFAQRAGLLLAGARGASAFKSQYPSTRPNVAAAEAERARLLEAILKK